MDADGKYGDHGITPAMRRVEARLDHGTLVPDTEKFALKSPDRFKEKLAKMIGHEPEDSVANYASEIHDGIRYTFLFDTENYTEALDRPLPSSPRKDYELLVCSDHAGVMTSTRG